jgi:hypothetical protein
MRRSAAWTIGLLVAAWASPGECQSSAPKPVHTGKSRFAVPFRSDPAELQRLGAREMRLFVSVDSGGNWLHVQSVSSEATRFTVRAQKDGEYWFAVRTVDREGRLHPEGKLSAELKVVVDSRSPTLEIKLTSLADGTAQLAWKADDDHLDVGSLVLEYRRRGESGWRGLSVTPAAEGKTSWDVPEGGVIEARGRIADLATNVAVANDSIDLVGTRNSVPRPSLPDVESDPLAGVIQRGANGSAMPARFPSPTAGGHETASGPEVQGFRAARQEEGGRRKEEGGRRKTDKRNLLPLSALRSPALTPVPRRIVNRKRFQLNYSVDSVGRSGVESVELFITVNDGGKWYRYGPDPDAKSPFPVVVPEDGTYGFAIRVRSGAGISDPPPRPGEKPEIVVVVDQTAPKLQLLPILQGRGSDADKFLIRWNMSDAHPAEKPISIAWSESAKGPWKTITGWRAAAGSYLWTTAGDVPARVYVRLTARDEAGNVSAVQTHRPIIIDVVKPSARITNVEVAPN